MSRKNKRNTAGKDLLRYRDLPNVTVSTEKLGYSMSDVFARFAEPFMDDVTSFEDTHSVYCLAATAWNMALYPQHKRIKLLMSVLSDLPMEDRLLFKDAIAEMVAHKEHAFADYRRLIVDFTITEEGDRYHLSVLSDATEEVEAKKTPEKE